MWLLHYCDQPASSSHHAVEDKADNVVVADAH